MKYHSNQELQVEVKPDSTALRLALIVNAIKLMNEVLDDLEKEFAYELISAPPLENEEIA